MPDAPSQTEIVATERETIRLFAIDLPAAQVDAFVTRRPAPENDQDPWPLRGALGATQLDPEHIEVFAAKDLTGLGLSGYLEEGHAIDGADLDAAALDAETGHILLLHARAFAGQAQRLAPQPPLRALGSYRVAPMAPPIDMAPAPDMAPTGGLGAPTDAPAHSNKGGAVALVLIGAALLLVLVLLFGLGGPF